MSDQMKLVLTPRKAALASGQENELDVLVRIQAPDTPESSEYVRPDLNLALVIDRSGSMAGEPLHEAKKCAQFMIDNLGPNDRAALIAYDDGVRTLVPNTRAAEKEKFRRALSQINEGGMTNLHGGWLAGAEAASDQLAENVMTRVILFVRHQNIWDI